MELKGLLVTFLGVLTTLSACGGSPPAQPGAAPLPAAAAPRAPETPPAQVAAARALASQTQASTAAVTAVADVLAPLKARYEPKGRRDPFESLETEKKKGEVTGGLSVTVTRLTGIVRGGTTMALVEAPDGVGYILKPGDVLGDGRLLEIGRDTAVFVVQPKPGSTANRVVLKLTAD